MNDRFEQDPSPVDDIQLDAVPQEEDDIQQDTAQVEGALLATAQENTLADVVRDWWLRVRAGDLGSLPIILGFIIITMIFGLAEPLFFSSRTPSAAAGESCSARACQHASPAGSCWRFAMPISARRTRP